MTLLPLLAAAMVAAGVYLGLSRRLRKKIIGAALLAQAVPLAVLVPGPGLPLLEALAILALPMSAAGFLAVIMRVRGAGRREGG